MRADIAEIRRAQRQKAAVGVEREFGGHREIAAHIVADKRLVAFGRPFDRASDPARAPGDHREFGKEAVARAEIAADLAGDDAHGFPNGTPRIAASSLFCRTMPPEPA